MFKNSHFCDVWVMSWASHFFHKTFLHEWTTGNLLIQIWASGRYSVKEEQSCWCGWALWLSSKQPAGPGQASGKMWAFKYKWKILKTCTHHPELDSFSVCKDFSDTGGDSSVASWLMKCVSIWKSMTSVMPSFQMTTAWCIQTRACRQTGGF